MALFLDPVDVWERFSIATSGGEALPSTADWRSQAVSFTLG